MKTSLKEASRNSESFFIQNSISLQSLKNKKRSFKKIFIKIPSWCNKGDFGSEIFIRINSSMWSVFLKIVEFHQFKLATKLIIQLIFLLKLINHALLNEREKRFRKQISFLFALSPSDFMIDGAFLVLGRKAET